MRRYYYYSEKLDMFVHIDCKPKSKLTKRYKVSGKTTGVPDDGWVFYEQLYKRHYPSKYHEEKFKDILV